MLVCYSLYYKYGIVPYSSWKIENDDRYFISDDIKSNVKKFKKPYIIYKIKKNGKYIKTDSFKKLRKMPNKWIKELD